MPISTCTTTAWPTMGILLLLLLKVAIMKQVSSGWRAPKKEEPEPFSFSATLHIRHAQYKTADSAIIWCPSFGIAWGMTSKQPPVSTPSVIGTTTMPKKTLSYRWIINDAKVFLQNIDVAAGFKSPTFPLTLPLKDVSRQTINWHLLIKSRTTNYFSVSLCRGANGSKSKVLISDCIFSLLRLENNTVKKSKVAPSTEVVIGSSTKDVSVSDFIVLSDLDDGALIIQVDAILLCFTDYCESIKTLEPPKDNIRDNIKSLQQDQHFSDLTITSGGKQFKVHKAILVSQSPVFQRMLAAEMAEKKRSSIVKMTDISPAALSDLVAYLYTGIAPNVNTNTLAKELLSAANKYELPRLLQICERKNKCQQCNRNALLCWNAPDRELEKGLSRVH